MEQLRKIPFLRTSRQGLISLAVALLLTVGGASLISYGVLAKSHPPLPSAAARAKAVSLATEGFYPGLAYAEPTFLRIPAIDVSSPLIRLGLNNDGSPEVPAGNDVDKAGWYKYSKTPGEPGTAVIEGHVDSNKSGPSVFYNLGKLQPGDKLYVQRQDNTVAVFEVTAVKLFPKDNFPIQTVYDNPTPFAALHLITCGGEFDQATHSYLSNTVVFSTLIGIQHNLPSKKAQS